MHQFQSVHGIMFDVFDDITTLHPFRNGRKLPLPDVPMNTEKLQDVGVRQLAPKNDHSTKPLEVNDRSAIE